MSRVLNFNVGANRSGRSLTVADIAASSRKRTRGWSGINVDIKDFSLGLSSLYGVLDSAVV